VRELRRAVVEQISEQRRSGFVTTVLAVLGIKAVGWSLEDPQAVHE
jgi:hypothetical protein